MVVWPRASRTVLRVVLELLGGGRVAKEEGEGGEDILPRGSKGLRLRQRLDDGVVVGHCETAVRSLVRETVGEKSGDAVHTRQFTFSFSAALYRALKFLPSLLRRNY